VGTEATHCHFPTQKHRQITLKNLEKQCWKYIPWPTKTSTNQWKPFWKAGISVPWCTTKSRKITAKHNIQ